ncbi:MAG: YggT family protein [Patescibacteria group bacterium]
MTRETKQVATTAQRTEYVLYFILGALEILLAFRLILKLTGASMASGFVTFIYGLTGIFVQPFEGIFRSATSAGVETTAVFEPSTVVAMIVYALLVWGIVKLIHIFSGEKLESE